MKLVVEPVSRFYLGFRAIVLKGTVEEGSVKQIYMQYMQYAIYALCTNIHFVYKKTVVMYL